jgi:hypothetical protein
VKFDASEYPVLAVTPDVVFNRKVVPEGGFTKPIVIRSVDEALNPFSEKPLTIWLVVLCG